MAVVRAAQLARYPASERPAGCPVAVLSCPIEHPSPGGFIWRMHSHTRSGVNETWGGAGIRATLFEPARLLQVVRAYYSNAWAMAWHRNGTTSTYRLARCKSHDLQCKRETTAWCVDCVNCGPCDYGGAGVGLVKIGSIRRLPP